MSTPFVYLAYIFVLSAILHFHIFLFSFSLFSLPLSELFHLMLSLSFSLSHLFFTVIRTTSLLSALCENPLPPFFPLSEYLIDEAAFTPSEVSTQHDSKHPPFTIYSSPNVESHEKGSEGCFTLVFFAWTRILLLGSRLRLFCVFETVTRVKRGERNKDTFSSECIILRLRERENGCVACGKLKRRQSIKIKVALQLQRQTHARENSVLFKLSSHSDYSGSFFTAAFNQSPLLSCQIHHFLVFGLTRRLFLEPDQISSVLTETHSSD